MTIEEILKELERYRGYLPREALAEAVEKQAEITPELLKNIQYVMDHPKILREDKRYFAHNYAMFLLAQFREPRAYPLIAELYKIPEDIAFDFANDIITGDLGRILASVCNGDTSLIKELIENEKVDEFVRSAGISALCVLVAVQEKSREEIIGYFKELFDKKFERTPFYTWNVLVDRSTLLYPEELLEEIEKAYRDELIETFLMPFDMVEEALEKGKEQVILELQENPEYSLIGDTISELENEALFKTKEESFPSPNPESSPKEEEEPPQQPYVRETKKIGRNKPCPCGSGKKYKKCCLK